MTKVGGKRMGEGSGTLRKSSGKSEKIPDSKLDRKRKRKMSMTRHKEKNEA